MPDNPRHEPTREPVLHVRFHVNAYNESWGGYGDDRSSSFATEAEAVAYARTMPDHLHPVTVWKKITMDPITVQVEWKEPANAD